MANGRADSAMNAAKWKRIGTRLLIWMVGVVIVFVAIETLLTTCRVYRLCQTDDWCLLAETGEILMDATKDLPLSLVVMLFLYGLVRKFMRKETVGYPLLRDRLAFGFLGAVSVGFIWLAESPSFPSCVQFEFATTQAVRTVFTTLGVGVTLANFLPALALLILFHMGLKRRLGMPRPKAWGRVIIFSLCLNIVLGGICCWCWVTDGYRARQGMKMESRFRAAHPDEGREYKTLFCSTNGYLRVDAKADDWFVYRFAQDGEFVTLVRKMTNGCRRILLSARNMTLAWCDEEGTKRQNVFLQYNGNPPIRGETGAELCRDGTRHRDELDVWKLLESPRGVEEVDATETEVK